MNAKMNVSWKSNGTTKTLILSVGFCVLITVLFSMCAAWMICNEKIREEYTGYVVMIIILLASFGGSIMACEKSGCKRLTIAVLTGFIYFVVLMSIGILIYDGTLRGVGETMLIVLCGSILGAMWTTRGKKRGKVKFPNR